ncbi:TIF1B [Mytilus edulis]|uniref:TRIM28 n=1 Tax=Mytilus edulis TaxID=6550 RepID=A0A8S3QIB0_MYTED|nr:TIF1B [Mytilus edulis]
MHTTKSNQTFPQLKANRTVCTKFCDMASSSQNCGVCDLRHINKPSIIWCTECDEGLCQECQEHHSLSKGSRNHSTIAITEYQTLSSDVLQITQYCNIHKEKIIIYCRKHERPCCRKCIVETHNECRDIDNLEDVIQNVKSSNAFYDIDETLVEVAENLKEICQHQQKSLLNLKEKRKQIENEIEKTRTTINNHLTNYKKILIKQLNAIEETQDTKICQLLSSLEQREKEITKISCPISKVLEKYRLKPKPCDIVLSRKKTKQAQIMVPTAQRRSIENIKLKKNKTIVTQGTSIYGCCLIPDGRMAFTYYLAREVRVYSDTGLKQFGLKMPYNADDILYISLDDTLVVSSGGDSFDKCIAIINVKRKQITKTITLDSYIYGIALRENNLIYSAYNKGIRMINLSDESITQIVQDKMPGCCYIATFRNQIYHTNSVTHAVTCYDQQGKPQWTFKNESLLKDPRGIDVDMDGNVYVVEQIRTML